MAEPNSVRIRVIRRTPGYKPDVRISWTEVQLHYLRGTPLVGGSLRYEHDALQRAVTTKRVTGRHVHQFIELVLRPPFRALEASDRRHIVDLCAADPRAITHFREHIRIGSKTVDGLVQGLRAVGQRGSFADYEAVMRQSDQIEAYRRSRRKALPPPVRIAADHGGVLRGLEMLSDNNKRAPVVARFWANTYMPGQHFVVSFGGPKRQILIVNVDNRRGITFVDYTQPGLWRCSWAQLNDSKVGDTAKVLYEKTAWIHKLTKDVLNLLGDVLPGLGKMITGARAASLVTFVATHRESFYASFRQLSDAVKTVTRSPIFASFTGGTLGVVTMMFKAHVPQIGGSLIDMFKDPKAMLRLIVRVIGAEAAARAVLHRGVGKAPLMSLSAFGIRWRPGKHDKARLASGRWKQRRGPSWATIEGSLPANSKAAADGLLETDWNLARVRGRDIIAQLFALLLHGLKSLPLVYASFAIGKTSKAVAAAHDKATKQATELLGDAKAGRSAADTILRQYFPDGGQANGNAALRKDAKVLEDALRQADQAIRTIIGLMQQAFFKAMW